MSVHQPWERREGVDASIGSVSSDPEIAKLGDYLAELDATEGDGRLFLLTPDAQRPSALDAIEDTRLTWIDFRSLSAAFDQVIEEDAEGIADRDRFLLRELQALF